MEHPIPRPLPGHHTRLPAPDPEAMAHSRRLEAVVAAEIGRTGGIPFDSYMERVLYTPGLGYYTGARRKFGADGDFVTAPEVSPLFARCMARQCGQVLGGLAEGDVLEFGAGSGAFAADLLAALDELGRLPRRYLIMEVSGELRERQRERLAAAGGGLLDLVTWLDGPPDAGFEGVVVAHEVLDAMPVNRFRIQGGRVQEQFVVAGEGGLASEWRAARNPALEEAVASIASALGPFEEGFESEINLRLAPWIEQISGFLSKGAALLVDYGYPRREYYHPMRRGGTLMCHYRHRAHPDPLLLPGLQDITAHVDFTAAAEAALAAGLSVEGFTTQAYFLMNTGLGELIGGSDPEDVRRHMMLMQEVKQLTLPSEMGERFKVLGLGRGLTEPLLGFGFQDQRFRL